MEGGSGTFVEHLQSSVIEGVEKFENLFQNRWFVLHSSILIGLQTVGEVTTSYVLRIS